MRRSGRYGECSPGTPGVSGVLLASARLEPRVVVGEAEGRGGAGRGGAGGGGASLSPWMLSPATALCMVDTELGEARALAPCDPAACDPVGVEGAAGAGAAGAGAAGAGVAGAGAAGAGAAGAGAAGAGSWLL